jgi:hypothetical protein
MMRQQWRTVYFLVFPVWLALLMLPVAGFTQVNLDKYRDYFLVGQFGEVCTMCEITVICAAGEAPPAAEHVPDAGTYTLYHLQTRTFWSQVSTIWEWFAANFSSEPLAARGHTRPVHVHRVTDGQWAPLEIIEARLVLDPGVLEFGPTQIDRITRQWQDAATGQPLGYCVRLPLWETLDVIAQHTAEGGKP